MMRHDCSTDQPTFTVQEEHSAKSQEVARLMESNLKIH